ncbi:MAG TPA: Xaa-Pro peptidase family protein [Xanthobacteraceae bacterium]|nr:Xaa-Pro peptidase family protein [Xanthobacteraceae bacterium]
MLTQTKPSDLESHVPFDAGRLDRLMDEAALDVVIATSKHNVQYLLGGHRALFFDYMDAMGVSRYLPVFVYVKDALDRAAYFGHRLEGYQRDVRPFWVANAQTSSSGSVDAMQKAIDHIRWLDLRPRRIGVEVAFLPLDAGMALRSAFPDVEIADALVVLERQRARKSADELEKLRIASDRIIDSMLAVVEDHGPGATKLELAEALRREETNRGLTFEYCLIAAGTSHNRAPSDQKWREGDVLSLDSGGNYRGYIGDVARMAILGEPDAELDDLLAEIDEVQQTAFKAIRAGAIGGDIYAVAGPLVRRSRQHNHMHFLAHGMGLVSHEAPRLTNRGPVPYTDDDAHRPLEAGMVISVETTLLHPRRGFIKLEDTVAVTEAGYDIYGDRARGWLRGGAAL